MARIIRDIISLVIAGLILWGLYRILNLNSFFGKSDTITDDNISLNISGSVSGSGNCNTPRGSVVPHGQSVLAYEKITVGEPGQCKAEFRQCVSGNLKGSYQYKFCDVDSSSTTVGEVVSEKYGTASCKTPWATTILHGDYVIAYKDARTSKGTCVAERRYCENGNLKGSYPYDTCRLSFGGNPINSSTTSYSSSSNNNTNKCYTPRGSTVSNGQKVTAYKNEYSFKGQSCLYETKTCDNGYLGLNFNKKSCAQINMSSYEFYNNIYGNNSQYIPTNSCRTPWNTYVKQGDYVMAYKYSTISCDQVNQGLTNNPFEKRYCNGSNGVLGGSYQYASAGSMPQCGNQTANYSCTTPRGTQVNPGKSVKAYKYNGLSCGQPNPSEDRYCDGKTGLLGGSYTYQNDNSPLGCVLPPQYSCTTPRGTTVSNGTFVTAYRQNPTSLQCESQTVQCQNGVLPLTYTNQSCSSIKCTTPRGTQVNPFDIVKGFSASVAPAGKTCDDISDTKTCQANGFLGLNIAYKYQTCVENSQPNGQSCVSPRGTIMQNGSKIDAFDTQNGTCNKRTRYCSNGTLEAHSGLDRYIYQTCNSSNNENIAGSCVSPRGTTIKNGGRIDAFDAQNGTCNKRTRYCSNGTLDAHSGLDRYIYQTCN